MDQFPHLPLVQKIKNGHARLTGGGTKGALTVQNLINRKAHGDYLNRQILSIETNWLQTIQKRESQGLPKLNKDEIPLYLQIDEGSFNVQEAFNTFKIEVISENEDGYIIGASIDNMVGLRAKISSFLNTKGKSKDQAAQLWQIVDGTRWRIEQILSDELFSKWDQITNDTTYIIDVGIACHYAIGNPPKEGQKRYIKKLNEYRKKQEERDEYFMQRQDQFEGFVNYYGTIISSYFDNEDSFSCRINISGNGLKDLVLNFPYLFEVSEPEEIEGIESLKTDLTTNGIILLPPSSDSPMVVVIDSGIMENHQYLQPAINLEKSKSYLPNNSSTADHVRNGGHGTKVAGCILYPNGIKGYSQIEMPCFIRNARVLNDENNLPVELFPPELMLKISNDNLDCKIFNLSINTKAPFKKRHISQWAASIDKISHENNQLFIISTGNIPINEIQDSLIKGNKYPFYLDSPINKLANPAQSCFGLTVGSVNISDFDNEYYASIGQKDEVSPFSRNGLGIWDMIKPDVVEFGGGLAKTKNGPLLVSSKAQLNPELIRSTLDGGSAIGQDCSGTSFSTPKVAAIAVELLKLYPNENVNLLRAFIAQSARHPENSFNNLTIEKIKQIGYGIPSLERATQNSNQRITFYKVSSIKARAADIYSIKIPTELNTPGEEYDILIEVSLSYTSKVRRTRQKLRNYLATWLSWESSKKGQSLADFKRSTIKFIDANESSASPNGFQWKIGDRSNSGIKDINRNRGSLQKDWAILKSYDLPDELGIAVKGHPGWDKNNEEIPYAIVVSIEVLGANIPIYENVKIENIIEIELNNT